MTEPALHVCFVCSGNICRSPMAAVVFRANLRREGLEDQVRVSSAGIGPWHVGEPADARALATLEQHGYDGTHIATQIDDEHLNADLLLAADAGHVRDLRRKLEDPSRVRLLREFDPAAPEGAEVPDPYYGGEDGFEDVLAMIEGAMPGLLDWVRQNPGTLHS